MEFYVKGQFKPRQPHPEYERLINLGAEIISRLLLIYPELRKEYENEKGKKVRRNGSYAASRALVEIKKCGRKFYPDHVEEKMLQEVARWDDGDYREILKDFKF